MRVFAAAVFYCWSALAFAQSPPADPVELVKSFYVPNYNESESMPLSPRLEKLFKAASDNSKKLDQPVAGLDFSWTLNGQDSEENTLKTVKVGAPAKQGRKTIIRVAFRNGGPMELQYDLVEVGGKWLVDDIHSVRKPKWTLSRMLDMGAKEKG